MAVCIPFFQGVFTIFPVLYLLLNGFPQTRQPRASLGFCSLTENKPGVADMMIRAEPQMDEKCLVNLWITAVNKAKDTTISGCGRGVEYYQTTLKTNLASPP